MRHTISLARARRVKPRLYSCFHACQQHSERRAKGRPGIRRMGSIHITHLHLIQRNDIQSYSGDCIRTSGPGSVRSVSHYNISSNIRCNDICHGFICDKSNHHGSRRKSTGRKFVIHHATVLAHPSDHHLVMCPGDRRVLRYGQHRWRNCK